MRNRYRKKQCGVQGYANLIPQLERWALGESRLLLVEGEKKAQAPLHFVIDVVQMVSQSSVPIVWAFSNSHVNAAGNSLKKTLCSLAIQALQIPRDLSSEESFLTPAEIEGAVNDQDWLLVLKRAFSGIKQAYIVNDTAVWQNNSTRRDQRRIINLTNQLQEQSLLAGLGLKVILVARKFMDRVDNDVESSRLRPLRLSTDVAGPGKIRRGKMMISKDRVRPLRPLKATATRRAYDLSAHSIEKIFLSDKRRSS